MKHLISILLILFILLFPKSSFAFIYQPTNVTIRDSLLKTETPVALTEGDKIAKRGVKFTTIGTILLALFLVLVSAFEFQEANGFLLLLVSGSLVVGSILILIGFLVGIKALRRKDTTELFRIKARTSLLFLPLGILAIIRLLKTN